MADQLDPVAVERVVQRAIELEDRDRAEPSEALPADAVVRVATEAGISPAAVRTSLAIEWLGPEPGPSRLDRVVGPATVVAERHVRTGAREAFERLDEWLVIGHHLRREHTDGGPQHGVTAEWRKRSDLAASAQRRVRSTFGAAGLASVRTLIAHVSPIDDDRAIIRLTADRSMGRTAALTVSGGVGATTVTGAAAVATAVPPLAVVAVPGLVVAAASARVSKRSALRLSRELAVVLDQIDVGERPKALTAITRRFTRNRR